MKDGDGGLRKIKIKKKRKLRIWKGRKGIKRYRRNNIIAI